jgi:Isocitrate lyase family
MKSCWAELSSLVPQSSAASHLARMLHAESHSDFGSPLLVQVLVPVSQFVRSLTAARLAADVMDVPTVLIARTDAHSANLLTADIDEVDRQFCTGERTPEGFFRYNGGVKVPALSSCIRGPSLLYSRALSSCIRAPSLMYSRAVSCIHGFISLQVLLPLCVVLLCLVPFCLLVMLSLARLFIHYHRAHSARNHRTSVASNQSN